MKKKPPMPPVPLTLGLSRPVMRALVELLEHGTFGRSLEEVAQGVLCHRLRELELQGFCGTARKPPLAPSRIGTRADTRARRRG